MLGQHWDNNLGSEFPSTQPILILFPRSSPLPFKTLYLWTVNLPLLPTASIPLISQGHCISGLATRPFLTHLVLCHQQIWSWLKLHQRNTQQRRCEAAADQTERQEFTVSFMKRVSVNAALQKEPNTLENQYKFHMYSRCSTAAWPVMKFVSKKACIVSEIFPKVMSLRKKLVFH